MLCNLRVLRLKSQGNLDYYCWDPVWFMGWWGEGKDRCREKLSRWRFGVIILPLNSTLERYYECSCLALTLTLVFFLFLLFTLNCSTRGPCVLPTAESCRRNCLDPGLENGFHPVPGLRLPCLFCRMPGFPAHTSISVITITSITLIRAPLYLPSAGGKGGYKLSSRKPIIWRREADK